MAMSTEKQRTTKGKPVSETGFSKNNQRNNKEHLRQTKEKQRKTSFGNLFFKEKQKKNQVDRQPKDNQFRKVVCQNQTKENQRKTEEN